MSAIPEFIKHARPFIKSFILQARHIDAVLKKSAEATRETDKIIDDQQIEKTRADKLKKEAAANSLLPLKQKNYFK